MEVLPNLRTVDVLFGDDAAGLPTMVPYVLIISRPSLDAVEDTIVVLFIFPVCGRNLAKISNVLSV